MVTLPIWIEEIEELCYVSHFILRMSLLFTQETFKKMLIIGIFYGMFSLPELWFYIKITNKTYKNIFYYFSYVCLPIF